MEPYTKNIQKPKTLLEITNRLFLLSTSCRSVEHTGEPLVAGFPEENTSPPQSTVKITSGTEFHCRRRHITTNVTRKSTVIY